MKKEESRYFKWLEKKAKEQKFKDKVDELLVKMGREVIQGKRKLEDYGN